MLMGTASCSSTLVTQKRQELRIAKIIHKQEIKAAKAAAELARVKADTLSVHRSTVQHYNDPYYFNRFTAGFQGRYFYQPYPIIIRRSYGNNNNRYVNPVRRNRGNNRNTPVVRPQRPKNNTARRPVRVQVQTPRPPSRLPMRQPKNKINVKQ